MAFPALGVQRSLQPWRIAGLRHWLYDSEEDRAMAVRGVRPQQTQSVQTVSAASGVPVASIAAPGVPPVSPIPPRDAPRPGTPRIEASRTEETHTEASHNEAPRTSGARPPIQRTDIPRAEGVRAAPDLETPPKILPVNAWPDDWKTLLARCPAQPKVVWTYPAMSDDYGGRSDPVRREFLQRLLKDLSMPAGSNAFWPLSAPPFTIPDQEADPLFFHSGIAALNPKMVAFLGAVPESLLLPRLLPMVPGLFQGRRLVRVQPVETLCGFLTAEDVESQSAGMQRHDSLVQFLKSVLMTALS